MYDNYGGYGVMVNTPDCDSEDESSILSSHPILKCSFCERPCGKEWCSQRRDKGRELEKNS